MYELDNISQLIDRAGQSLGTSDWFLIDQALIDGFAKLTGDHNWVHVDIERARRELPGGKTIAHALLTFSLVPMLAGQIFSVRDHGGARAYGSNKARYMSPVPAGARIRLHLSLDKAEKVDKGILLTRRNVIEIEGVEKPAMVAETLTLVFDPETPGVPHA